MLEKGILFLLCAVTVLFYQQRTVAVTEKAKFVIKSVAVNVFPIIAFNKGRNQQ